MARRGGPGKRPERLPESNLTSYVPCRASSPQVADFGCRNGIARPNGGALLVRFNGLLQSETLFEQELALSTWL
jgi:hypothetical protein